MEINKREIDKTFERVAIIIIVAGLVAITILTILLGYYVKKADEKKIDNTQL